LDDGVSHDESVQPLAYDSSHGCAAAGTGDNGYRDEGEPKLSCD
jgi:hypothetical protein